MNLDNLKAMSKKQSEEEKKDNLKFDLEDISFDNTEDIEDLDEENEEEDEEDKDDLEDDLDKDEDKDKDKDTDDLEDDDDDEEDDEEDKKEDDNDGEKNKDKPEESIFTSISKLVGYEIEEKELKKFPETEEGIAKFVEALAEKRQQDSLNEIFDNYPDVKQYLEYRNSGGKAEQYFKTMEDPLSSIKELKESDEGAQEKVIRYYFKTFKNMDEEEIEDTIEGYRAKDKLFVRAEKALGIIKNSKEEESKKLVEEQRKIKEQETEKAKEYWNTVKDTVKTGKLSGNILIPSKEKTAFFNYLTKPDKTGKTERIKDIEKASNEEMLALEYLRFKKFSLDDLVKQEANSRQVEKLKKKLKSQNRGGLSGGDNKDERDKRGSSNSYNLKSIFGS